MASEWPGGEQASRLDRMGVESIKTSDATAAASDIQWATATIDVATDVWVYFFDLRYVTAW